MEKLYTVTTPATIIGMDDIMGPLTTPSKMNFADVLDMVRRGYEIYQVNPYDNSEKIRVNISNINSIKFKTSISDATIQRKLNREIQEMNKSMLVDVVSKETKVESVDNNVEKPEKDYTKNKQNENKKNSDTAEKITKPDSFTK